MYTAEQHRLFKHILIVVSVILVAIVASLAWFITYRVGLIKVEAVLAPSDSKVTYKYGTISDGANYLRRGIHDITISRENFETRTYPITVTPDTEQVGIGTIPANKAGEKYLEEHRGEELRYEIIGGDTVRDAGKELVDRYPQIAELPKRHFSRTSVYTVSSGGSDVNNTPILVITNASTQGRLDALRWIKQQNYNLGEIIIKYDGYESPLQRGDN